eukprot:symbB.v1.2.028677.t1/scaffold3048.1/size64721/5
MAKRLTILTILRGFLAQCFLVHRGKRGREAPQPQLRPGCLKPCRWTPLSEHLLRAVLLGRLWLIHLVDRRMRMNGGGGNRSWLATRNLLGNLLHSFA